jgi:hypothetical protein
VDDLHRPLVGDTYEHLARALFSPPTAARTLLVATKRNLGQHENQTATRHAAADAAAELASVEPKEESTMDVIYPGRLFATAAGLGELTSGILLALGLLGPIGPALMIAVMIVAAVSVHWANGLFATANGIELPLLYAAGRAPDVDPGIRTEQHEVAAWRARKVRARAS